MCIRDSSYTSFSIGKPHLTKKSIRRDGSARILVDVTNTGPVSYTHLDVYKRQD